MPTLEGLRRQLQTASDLKSVVSTMKMLAAVSINQYEEAVDSLADYSRTIELGFQILLRKKVLHERMSDDYGRTAAIIFGSDQGMCGQFNEEIVQYASDSDVLSTEKKDSLLLAIGTRVEEQLLEMGWSVEKTYSVPTSVSQITTLVQQLLPYLERLRTKHRVTHLQTFFNIRKSASSYRSHREQILPIDKNQLQKWQNSRWESTSLPVFKTDERELFSRIVRQHLFVSLFRACAESLASENASRIAAMQAAEKNIEEQLDQLQGDFNQLRQSAITEELLDVVSGFEALSKPEDD